MSNVKPTKNEKREQAREKARELRLQTAKKDKRRKITIWSSVGLVALAIVAIVTVTVTTSLQPAAKQVNPRNMMSDGLLFTGPTEVVKQEARPLSDKRTITALEDDGKVNIVLYIDYSCPHCGEFEEENASTLKQWLAEDKITLEVHPVAVLGNEFAFRGANAGACVADIAPEVYLDYNEAVFSQNLEGGSLGLTNRNLYKIVDGTDTSDENKSSIKSCIKDNSFSNWVEEASTVALNEATAATNGAPLQGTPTVLVNGVQYTYSFDNETFRATIEGIMAGVTVDEDGIEQETSPTN